MDELWSLYLEQRAAAEAAGKPATAPIASSDKIATPQAQKPRFNCDEPAGE